MAGSILAAGGGLAGPGVDDARGDHAQAQHLLQVHLAWVTARVGVCLAAPLLFGDRKPGHKQKGLPLTEPLLCTWHCAGHILCYLGF